MAYITANIDYDSVADQVRSDRELTEMLNALGVAFADSNIPDHLDMRGALTDEAVKFIYRLHGTVDMVHGAKTEPS